MNEEWEGTSGRLGVVGVGGRVRKIIVKLYCRLRVGNKPESNRVMSKSETKSILYSLDGLSIVEMRS